MPRVTTAYVKNIVRRGFAEAVDPEPDASAISALWTHFGSRCAYCGTSLDRTKREGRVDHAVPASERGHNGLANRVLACGPCNDDEKRNEHWEVFLRKKNPGAEVYDQRRGSIIDWFSQNGTNRRSEVLSRAVSEAAADVNALFDAKIAEVRALACLTAKPR